MMTSRDLQEARFDKTMFNGYNAEQVDKLLDEAADTIESVIAENLILKEKIKTLSSQIDDYKINDSAIKDAVVTAQRMSSEIIGDARKKSDEILASTQQIAQSKIATYRDEMRHEDEKLSEAKARTRKFLDNLVTLFNNELLAIKTLDKKAMPEQDEPSELREQPPIPNHAYITNPEFDITREIDIPVPGAANVLIKDEPETKISVPTPTNDIFSAVVMGAEPSNQPASADDWQKAIAAAATSKLNEEPSDSEKQRFSGLKFGKHFDMDFDGDDKK